MVINIVAIATGGALGAIMRHGLNTVVSNFFTSGFPFGILAINVTGSFLMGFLAGVFALVYEPSQAMKLFVITGVLGGFTTFSAFSLDAVLLWERGAVLQSMIYVVSSVVFSIVALVAGLWLARGFSA